MDDAVEFRDSVSFILEVVVDLLEPWSTVCDGEDVVPMDDEELLAPIKLAMSVMVP